MDPNASPDFFINFILNGGLHRNWVSVTGFIILFAVHVAKKGGLKDIVPAKYVPVVSVALGILFSIGDNFITSSNLVWYDVLLKGFVAGASATGLWEMAFKYYLGTSAKAEVTAKATETSKSSGGQEKAPEVLGDVPPVEVPAPPSA
jgi:hypothetical protein